MKVKKFVRTDPKPSNWRAIGIKAVVYGEEGKPRKLVLKNGRTIEAPKVVV